VQLVKAAFRWASKKGYVGRSPISEDSALKRSKVAQRRRRLLPDEETLLLASAGEVTRGAGLRLQWLIIAALESGCRLGELLGLQWADLNLSKRTLLVRAVEQGARKTSQPRQLPVSARLAAVFEMARLDPTGRPYPPAAYVFGQLGQRVRSIKKAWETCVLRAHGHAPTWSKRGHKLSEEARAALRGVDLHFHDLRHEAGCRWLEAGWPIHHVQEMLGHSNLSQTSTYLHANEMGLQESMKKFDDARCTSVADSPAIEQRPLGKTEVDKPSKDLLH
jgi:integrase